jgi:hypothetical protein
MRLGLNGWSFSTLRVRLGSAAQLWCIVCRGAAVDTERL